MKHKALGLIYISSPRQIVVGKSGEELEVKNYKNGGKYVRDGKNQVPYGSIPKLSEADIRRFAEVFC